MSIVFYSRKNNCGVCFTNYTPKYVQLHSPLIFAFGDNLDQTGTGGQAIIRSESNIIGIPTKRKPTYSPDSYMTGTDSDYEAVTNSFLAIQSLIQADNEIVFPSNGIGTGLARLHITAPNLLSYIDSEISKLIGTDYKLLRQA